MVGRRGRAEAVVRVTDDARPGCVFSPFHWADSAGPLANVNQVTSDAVDPIEPAAGAEGLRGPPRTGRRVRLKPALRILVADTDAGRCATLAGVLRLCGYGAIEFALDEGAASRRPSPSTTPTSCSSTSTRPTATCSSSSARLQREVPRPVVMFSQDEDEGTIARAVEAGVSAYIVDGLASARVKPIIDVAIAHFRQQQAMRRELEHAKTTLDDRKHVDRAKGLLMSGRGVTEPEAYAVLRKAAMDRKQRIGRVAADMLAAAELLSPRPGHRRLLGIPPPTEADRMTAPAPERRDVVLGPDPADRLRPACRRRRERLLRAARASASPPAASAPGRRSATRSRTACSTGHR